MTGRYKEFALPEEYSRYYKVDKNYRYLVGFGWDYIENDYKVVVCFIFARSRQGLLFHPLLFLPIYFIAIYSHFNS